MADKMKLFSEEWCQAAMEAVNANDAVYKGFKDPKSFTNQMAFTCEEKGLTTHLEWQGAKLIQWTLPQFDESDLWLIINANLDTWRTAAEGASEGGKLLMAGKITFVKGPMSAAIENAGAFNNFLLSWGNVPTDWDV